MTDTKPKLTEAERESLMVGECGPCAQGTLDVEPCRCAEMLHAAVEAILRDRLAPVEAERDRARETCCACHEVAKAELQRERSAMGQWRRLAQERGRQVADLQESNVALLQRVADLTAERDGLAAAVDHARRRHPRGDEEVGILAPGLWCPTCGRERSNNGYGACPDRAALAVPAPQPDEDDDCICELLAPAVVDLVDCPVHPTPPTTDAEGQEARDGS